MFNSCQHKTTINTSNMFKLFVFLATLAVAFAIPAPDAKAEPKPKAEPSIFAYSSPIVATAPVTYTSAYNAPLAYAASPLAYSYSAYPAYSAYSSPYVTIL